MSMERPITHRYDDPLDLVWLETARRLGIRVRRSDEVYAAWDGKGCLTIGSPETLDPDDSLAQMVLHELCHALIQGPSGQVELDWGLCNTDDRDLLAEHACLRLQAKLSDPWGLRRFLAATTQWRAFYDALPSDPLTPAEDPAAQRAREGWTLAHQAPWKAPLQEALAATAHIAAVVRPLLAEPATEPSLWAHTVPPDGTPED